MIKEIIKDRDLILDVNNYDIILLASNILCTMGRGLLYKISINFPDVKIGNLMTKYGDIKKLGNVKVVELNNKLFCLCFISKGNFGINRYKDCVDYDALKSCLSLINNNFKDKRIACTILGHDELECCGDKEKIIEIIDNELIDNEIYLYDYKQIDYQIEDREEWKKVKNVLEEKGYEEYRKEKIKYLWRRTFGIYKEMPNNLSYNELKCIIDKEKEKRKEKIKNIVK